MFDGCCKKDEADKGPDNAGKTMRLLMPYIWPKGKVGLKVRVVLCIIMMIVNKIFTVWTPQQYKIVIDSLPDSYPVQAVIFYGVLKILTTLSSESQSIFFLNVSQNAVRMISTRTYTHLCNLSLKFHLNRNTGAVLRTIDRGTSAVQSLLRLMLFNIIPTLLELVMTCLVLLWTYQFYYSLFSFLTILVYVIFTLVVTEWRKKFRREMNEKDNETNHRAVDSLINFETVKYFTAEEHVVKRYESSLLEYFVVELRARWSLSFLNIGQSLIMITGSTVIMILASHSVWKGTMKIGDLVAINAYIMQLYRPLNFLGSSYNTIIQSFINMENMFDLLEEKNDVEDSDLADPLILDGGEIEFDNVTFAYSSDDRKILDGVSFIVPSNTTTAIVGPTGSGKSTIFRLLVRFYDPLDGSVYIDRQDIRTVTQLSLRSNIGVVPQDTVLFNDTISYNIAFGATGKDYQPTQEDVIQAAKDAHIHQYIKKMASGYDTMVGERGLRLSGGEKQRVAIARTILKNPPILILDEATSALDTKTEKEIQESLLSVSKGRTTLVIAHRLSTVVNADEILVLKEGKIIERGNHYDLLEQRGEYWTMWEEQSTAMAQEIDEASSDNEDPLIEF